MKSGRFSASSLAGTSTLTSTAFSAAPAARVDTLRPCGPVSEPGEISVTVMRATACLDALAHARGQHTELVAVFGDCTPGDLHAVLLQDVHDGLVRERMTRVLLGHELLDLCLD